MIRKQLYLTPEIERALLIASRQEGKPVAEVVREILKRNLKINKAVSEAPGSVLLKIASRAVKGPGDLSPNLTSYLYGTKSLNYGKRKKAFGRR